MLCSRMATMDIRLLLSWVCYKEATDNDVIRSPWGQCSQLGLDGGQESEKEDEALWGQLSGIWASHINC